MFAISLVIHVKCVEVPFDILLSHAWELMEGSEVLLTLVDQVCRHGDHALVAVLSVAPGVDEDMLHPGDCGLWVAASKQGDD